MNNTKILIVENESLVALDIKLSLEDLGYYITDICSSYEQVLISLNKELPHFVLMDINLNKKMSGIEIAAIVYEKYKISSIFITAYCDEETIKKAVKSNPLAYLSKPFKVEELHASIILAQHQQNSIEDKMISLGNDYFYKQSKKKIWFKDSLLKLSKKEETLLHLLVLAKGSIVYYEDIEISLWEGESISNDSLRSFVYRFRNKLKDLNIETVTSFGYKLIY